MFNDGDQMVNGMCRIALPSATTKLWHRRPACDSTGETPVPQISVPQTPVPQISLHDAKIPNVSSPGGGGFRRPTFCIRRSAPRWVAAKRRPAFTLMETVLAAAVTSLVAIAGSVMVFAVTNASSETRDLRSTKMAGHYALSQVAKTIRESRVIGAVTATTVILWLDDTNGDDVVNLGEAATIEHDPVTKQILFKTLDPASGIDPMTPVPTSVLTDSAQFVLLAPDTAQIPVSWADGVESLTLTGYPSLTETRVVGVQFVIGVGGDAVTFQTTASPRASGDYLFVSQAVLPSNGPSGRLRRKVFSRWDGFSDITNTQHVIPLNQQQLIPLF